MKESKKAQIKERLDQLSKANRGRLTPAIVIADAKNPRSPLHGQFTWDIKKAAQQRWIEQARELIRSVRIEVRTETHFVTAPRYVHDPRAGKESGYAELTTMRSSRDIAIETLQYELDRATAALERAQEVATALGLHGEIARFLNGIRGLREKKIGKAA